MRGSWVVAGMPACVPIGSRKVGRLARVVGGVLEQEILLAYELSVVSLSIAAAVLLAGVKGS